ncbi:hypothetical protein V865_001793 [Kwoniella europaea PYCC6329]|uniref:Uncharacterized protein n=1 Tax=Kwoniella europaea PYCC6329 TaxID=1423913 RepID=A0AAX4KBF1_9TREE
MISDTVKIAIVVASPIILFTLLFLSAYLYRRHRNPFRKGSFRRKPQHEFTELPCTTTDKGLVWDPTKKKKKFPHCHVCWEDHRSHNIHDCHLPIPGPMDSQNTLVNNSKIQINVEPDSNDRSVPSLNGDQLNIAQPHFEDKRLSIRRISINPLAPDEYTRVNSFCSSLNQNAKTSSGLLPQPAPALAMADHLEPGSIDFGCRRSSSSLGVSDNFAIRRISVGGKEDTLNIPKGYSLDSGWEDIPIRRSFTENQRDSIQELPTIVTSFSPLPYQTPIASGKSGQGEESGGDLPSPHPFSAASLRRSSFISQPPIEFPIPHIKLPQKAMQKERQNRPGSLNIPSYTASSPSQFTSLSGTTYVDGNGGRSDSQSLNMAVRSASSTQAIKSCVTPLPKSSVDTCSSFGHNAFDGTEIQREKYFEDGWNGFADQDRKCTPGGEEGSRGRLIPKIEIPISPTTPTTYITDDLPASIMDQVGEGSKLAQTQVQGDSKYTDKSADFKLSDDKQNDHKRTPSQLTISSPTQTPNIHKRAPSNASRVTYLSDVVKEKEEEEEIQRRSVYSTPEELYPAEGGLAGKRTNSTEQNGKVKICPQRKNGDRPASNGIQSALATGLGVGMVVGMSQGEMHWRIVSYVGDITSGVNTAVEALHARMTYN